MYILWGITRFSVKRMNQPCCFRPKGEIDLTTSQAGKDRNSGHGPLSLRTIMLIQKQEVGL